MHESSHAHEEWVTSQCHVTHTNGSHLACLSPATHQCLLQHICSMTHSQNEWVCHSFETHAFPDSLSLSHTCLTGLRRCIGCLKLQVSFCKRTTNYGAFLRKWPRKMRHPMYFRHPVWILWFERNTCVLWLFWFESWHTCAHETHVCHDSFESNQSYECCIGKNE